MNATIDRKQETVAGSRVELRLASVWGMDSDARAAVRTLAELAAGGSVGVVGRFMPDGGISERLRGMGVAEEVEEADFFRFAKIVIPYGGVAAGLRKQWEEKGLPLVDLSAPQVRRAQVALGLLRMEGAQPLVIGRHDDPETRAIAGGKGGSRVLQDTTDTARLGFSPAFGVVCQTTISPRRVQWLVQQLRLRWRDARVTFLDTLAPSMTARIKAMEDFLVWCDSVVVVGDAGEASCEALVETALRRGKPAFAAATPADLARLDLAGIRRIALTAGAFATDAAVRRVATALLRR